MTKSASGTSTWRRTTAGVLAAGMCLAVAWSWVAEDPEVRGGPTTDETELFRSPDEILSVSTVLRENSADLNRYLTRFSLVAINSLMLEALEGKGVVAACVDAPSSPGKTFVGISRVHRFGFGVSDSPSTRRLGPTYAACPTTDGEIVVGTSAEGAWNVTRSAARENVRPIARTTRELEALSDILESPAGFTKLSQLLEIGPVTHLEVEVTDFWAKSDPIEGEVFGRLQVYCEVADGEPWEVHRFEFRIATESATSMTVELTP